MKLESPSAPLPISPAEYYISIELESDCLTVGLGLYCLSQYVQSFLRKSNQKLHF